MFIVEIIWISGLLNPEQLVVLLASSIFQGSKHVFSFSLIKLLAFFHLDV